MAIGLEDFPRISQPATRALHSAGYSTLGQLAGVSRASLAELHGAGPKALGIVDAELAAHGLRLS